MRTDELATHSTLDSMFSGLARSTTKMRMGTKASADVESAPLECRMSPDDQRGGAMSPSHESERTKNDFAAIEDADHLVTRSLVVIDL